MSSYSFSNQFYQHWTSAPGPVRAAIVQELTDITTLLHTDTAFEEYTFSTHDLDAHLDDLYRVHQKQQILENDIADKQAKLRAEAEQQRLEDEKSAAKLKLKQAAIEQEKNTTEKEQSLSQTISIESDNSDIDRQFDDSQTSAVSNIAEHLVIHHSSKNDKAINHQNKLSSSISLSLKNAPLDTDPQSLIQELEVQIDDYLTEQMLLMSENLKSWLRAEVTQQLGYDMDTDTDTDANDKKKS